MIRLLVIALIVLSFVSIAQAQTPDSLHCSAEPWDTRGNAIVIPGTDISYDDLIVIVRDEFNDPVTFANVSIEFFDCTDLCIDTPSGLSGTTDINGEVTFNPSVGGCEVCTINIIADGVVIRSYDQVISPDWDGSFADGIVDSDDLDYFQTIYNTTEPCGDYNGDGITSLHDFGLMGEWMDNAANLVPCYPPGCQVDPDTIDFGLVFVSLYYDTIFTIKNTGGTTLSGFVSESCPDYTIIDGGGGYNLDPGDSIDVTIRFQPIAPGDSDCIIETGDAICNDVRCEGFSEPPPLCYVWPTSIDFDTVMVGDYQDTTFVIRNDGGGTIVGTPGESCDHYEIISGGDPYVLAAYDSVVVTLRFEPADSGTFDCTIDAGAGGCLDVSCTGFGMPAHLCYVDPDTLDFGNVNIGDYKDLSFVIANHGESFLDGIVSESCDNFSIVSGAGAYSLGADDTVVVTVRYEPATEGMDDCTLETGNGTCDDVYLAGSVGPDPLIQSIADVGNDQGKQVRINFLKSARDVSGSSTPVLQYETFRRIDPLPQLASSEAGGIREYSDTETLIKMARESGMLSSPSGTLLQGWEYTGAVPAHGDTYYHMISPTLADSTISQGMHWSVFFVRAATAEPLIYFDSPVDSGYSLDNLSPYAPLGLSVAYNSGGGTQLEWEEHFEEDFQYFRIYRNESEDFIPDSGDLVQSTTGTDWLDTVEKGWKYYYKISAVDFSGNESDAVSATSTTGDDTPQAPDAFALYQNVPNPFNPSTTIMFDLPEAAQVKLCVYNVKGELITTIVDRHMTEGRKEFGWAAKDNGGRAVSSGIYFYRLVAGDFVQTKKMVLLR
jgi:hypothetical protein